MKNGYFAYNFWFAQKLKNCLFWFSAPYWVKWFPIFPYQLLWASTILNFDINCSISRTHKCIFAKFSTCHQHHAQSFETKIKKKNVCVIFTSHWPHHYNLITAPLLVKTNKQLNRITSDWINYFSAYFHN